jgi:5-methylcytosine-specific restriction enzyme subunit McrC
MVASALFAREYGAATDLASTLAASLGISSPAAEQLLRRAGERIQRTVPGLHANPVEISSAGVRVKGVAGVVELDGCELEVAPKYSPSSHAGWREDLLFLALFSKYGELMIQDHISAGHSAANDLSELAARVLLRMFYGNRRTPLRVRSMESFVSFDYDTEIETESLFSPTEDGFEQRGYRHSNDNEYASTVVSGARALLGRLRGSPVRAQLVRMVQDVGPQTTPPSRERRKLPPRLRHWQALYDLAFELARSGGLAPGHKGFISPGFAVNTWRTWQDVLAKSLVLALGATRVKNQVKFHLGSRETGGASVPLFCTPDTVVEGVSSRLIVDAKYKGESDQDFDHIGSADIYESLAFARATGSNRVVLIYPMTAPKPKETGASEVAERVWVGSIEIAALTVEINGIAKPGGLLKFVSGLKTGLSGVGAASPMTA